MFVIDSCHRDRLMEAHSELAKLLTEKELRDALLLIFANKQVMDFTLTTPPCEFILSSELIVSFYGVCVPGCSRRSLSGGDDGAAEPTQAVLWEELAHPGLRRPQRDGPPRGFGLALQAAGCCWGPGRSLTVSPLPLLTDSPLNGQTPNPRALSISCITTSEH